MTRSTTAGRRPTRAPADIEGAIAALGMEIRRADENEIHCHCPMHLIRTGRQDNHPSFSVNRNSGLHGCWSCGYSGNFIRLVMDLKFPNDAFRAARWMRQFGVRLRAHDSGIRVGQDAPVVPDPEAIDIPGRYAMYVDPPAKVLAARRITLEAAQQYGIRWDRNRENWILPIRTEEGQLLGWQIKNSAGRYFRNFPQGVKKGRCLFGLEVFTRDTPMVMLESPLDVARLTSAGVPGGVATFGAAWTETQMQLALEYGSELIAAFDNDDAGRAAVHLLIRGDRARRPWVPRINARIINYGRMDVKDVGDMTDEEIQWALTNAGHWITSMPRVPR